MPFHFFKAIFFCKHKYWLRMTNGLGNTERQRKFLLTLKFELMFWKNSAIGFVEVNEYKKEVISQAVVVELLHNGTSKKTFYEHIKQYASILIFMTGAFSSLLFSDLMSNFQTFFNANMCLQYNRICMSTAPARLGNPACRKQIAWSLITAFYEPMKKNTHDMTCITIIKK